MKLARKFLLALFLLVFLAQVPALYRRRQFARLDETVVRLNARRAPTPLDQPFADYPGALHVHTFLGGHSTGTFADVIAGAQRSGLAFVVMTEHTEADLDTRRMTLRGWHGGVLFVGGNETSEATQDHLITFGGTDDEDPAEGGTRPPGNPAAANADASTQAAIGRARAAGRLVFVAHPETFSAWQADGFDGMEIFNLHAAAKRISRPALLFEGFWSYPRYAQLFWTRFGDDPFAAIRQWDALTRGGARKVVAVAGNDAHANVGLSLQQLTGKPILQLKLDPYERSFRVVRTHVLLPRAQPLDTQGLLDALRRGHAYVAFDSLGNATGFRFTATHPNAPDSGDNTTTMPALMGDDITLEAGVRLSVSTPVRCRIVLVKDGVKLGEEVTDRRDWMISERGVYRIECYLPDLPAPLNDRPWIVSNPIYVR